MTLCFQKAGSWKLETDLANFVPRVFSVPRSSIASASSFLKKKSWKITNPAPLHPLIFHTKPGGCNLKKWNEKITYIFYFELRAEYPLRMSRGQGRKGAALRAHGLQRKWWTASSQLARGGLSVRRSNGRTRVAAGV
jgi:hypothetical protein